MDIHVYIHDALADRVPAWAVELARKMDLIISKENKIMSDVSDALDQLEKNTAAIEGADDSAEAAFKNLAVLIANLKTATTDPATAARITAASNALAARAAALGAAVAAAPTS